VRARGHARHRDHLNQFHLEEITRPEDPRLGDAAALLERTFTDPNSVLGLDRIRQFLSEPASAPAPRHFHVIAAVSADAARVLGLSIFSYVPRANCGFSEYLVVDQQIRGRGLGRALFDRRKATLDADARRGAQAACNGVFIEVDSPWRTPPALLAADSFDAHERLRIFAHLGFRRVSMPYVQPPLAPDKAPVEHLDLLFAPWATRPRGESELSARWIVDTLAPIWSAWAPSVAATYLGQLQQQLTGVRDVALVDPVSPT
jgi:GNAT superfamily N-acetyltransferase